VVDYFYSWQNDDSIKEKTRKNVKRNLEEIFLSLLPFKEISSNRYLFFPTNNGWTAYFGNKYLELIQQL
jgi:hypothetical protein